MNNEQTTDKSKKRGAPKGRRPVVWVCSGVINSKLVSERFVVKDQAPDSLDGKFPKEIAIDSYKRKYGIDPEVTFGPFYDKKGLLDRKMVRKRGSICRNIANIRLSKRDQKNAIYGGWHGIVNFLENDDDRAFFVFLREVSPDPKKDKNTPAPGTVPISDLEFYDNSTSAAS